MLRCPPAVAGVRLLTVSMQSFWHRHAGPASVALSSVLAACGSYDSGIDLFGHKGGASGGTGGGAAGTAGTTATGGISATGGSAGNAAAGSGAGASGGAGSGGAGGEGQPCTSSGQCSPPTPYCDPAAGVCVECLGDANCDSGVCDLGSHTCQGCTSGAQCDGARPFCDSATSTCVECVNDSQCLDKPHCEIGEHRCVDCLLSTDCGQGETCTDFQCHGG